MCWMRNYILIYHLPVGGVGLYIAIHYSQELYSRTHTTEICQIGTYGTFLIIIIRNLFIPAPWLNGGIDT